MTCNPHWSRTRIPTRRSGPAWRGGDERGEGRREGRGGERAAPGGGEDQGGLPPHIARQPTAAAPAPRAAARRCSSAAAQGNSPHPHSSFSSSPRGHAAPAPGTRPAAGAASQPASRTHTDTQTGRRRGAAAQRAPLPPRRDLPPSEDGGSLWTPPPRLCEGRGGRSRGRVPPCVLTTTTGTEPRAGGRDVRGPSGVESGPSGLRAGSGAMPLARGAERMEFLQRALRYGFKGAKGKSEKCCHGPKRSAQKYCITFISRFLESFFCAGRGSVAVRANALCFLYKAARMN